MTNASDPAPSSGGPKGDTAGPLADELVHPGAVLLDAASGTRLTGSELRGRVAESAECYTRLAPGIVFALTSPDLPGVLRYLGALAAARPVLLLDPALDRTALETLAHRFRPAAIVGADGPAPLGYRALDSAGWVRIDPDAAEPHPDLAVLLTTSGSTGNPKLVRLSRTAVLANARSIALALGLGPGEVAPTSLPLHYSYGLSVLNSHLVVGATVLIESNGVLARQFWRSVDEHRATSFAGVPYHYEMLRRIGFDPAGHPALRTLTQAGGRLRTSLVRDFADRMEKVGGRLVVMYGQTEATARMAVLPPERLADKLGTAGRAIPGGAFAIRPLDTAAPGRNGVGHPVAEAAGEAVGEVVYSGPNVMMGYAESEAELMRGDDLGGVLATGDLGRLDDEGFLTVTGRLKRIGKVFGTRVSLDDLEDLLRGHAAAAAVPGDDRIVVWLEGADSELCRAAGRTLAERLRVHASGFDVRTVPTLPLLASGKIDYRALEAGV
ncbi:AMP-binding protein [Yinghuangia seranimata]|uniref:AMP-binding protein n=1 Tax=Yinghuangia seranimata TaxID=408067 RepID=UPI00248CF358|nr:AMP-binding protein [Yinghuangia seranimata]MDI2127387.1 AMP-binding protein [Yinghuangia seranimata]